LMHLFPLMSLYSRFIRSCDISDFIGWRLEMTVYRWV
jgi:hypothetical protein